MTFEEIQNMKKATFNRISRQSIEHKTFEDLENKKQIHSKVKHIVHPKMKMQQYLKANKIKINREEMQLIFRMRCRVTEIRNNLKLKGTQSRNKINEYIKQAGAELGQAQCKIG